MTIGKRLREERERIGYSQQDFAALGGKTKKTQIEWEADKATPNGAFLAEVERVGVDVLYILTGRREAPLAAGYHVESSEGIDAVLDRMFEAAGKPFGFGYAKAFDVSERTLSTWRARGQVARRYLEGFAREWKTSVDWLQYGPEGKAVLGDAHQVAEKAAPYGISADERKLLENYRKIPAEVREALQLVASIASRPQAAGEHVKPPRAKVMPGELPHRKFKPPAVVGGEPAQVPARSRKKRGDT